MACLAAAHAISSRREAEAATASLPLKSASLSGRAFVSQTPEQGTDAHTYGEAGMLTPLGMLFAVGGIIWIIIVIVLVLLLLGFFFGRGR
jgi:hypothetical protein